METWKDTRSVNPLGSPDSSKSTTGINHPTTGGFFQNYWHNGHEFNGFIDNENDLSNIRSCIFPCATNERPSQGLSLSLSSSNPSIIGLPSFELRHHGQQEQADHDQMGGVVALSKPVINIHCHQELIQDQVFLGKVASFQYHQGNEQSKIRHSKYLTPTKELLNEICSLETSGPIHESRLKLHKSNQIKEDEEDSGICCSSKHSLYPLKFHDLLKRKTKLLQMLEEVDRRYKHYCEQMKAVVSSFEVVTGDGAATVYLALASKAMSRHFRCLRDAIVGQIVATNKVMGKEWEVPGATRRETPRLRVLDQTLRQQKSFQQMNMMDSHAWRPQRGLPEISVSVLRAWLFEHFLHPYPSDVDKHILARQTGLSRSQVSNWFINARVRLWKPMVEEMYVEQIKENNDNMGLLDEATILDDVGQIYQKPQTHYQHDQKLTTNQLVRIDSECLSSIINYHERDDNFGKIVGSFEAVELDFSSYNSGGSSGGDVSCNTKEQNVHNIMDGGGGGGGGGDVSLTLGLQQHGEEEMILAFSPTPHQSPLFYHRDDDIEDCQQVQYSIFDGEQQNFDV